MEHSPQESVAEGVFDDSADLVVWGHEDDCRIVPEPVAGKRYFMMKSSSPSRLVRCDLRRRRVARKVRAPFSRSPLLVPYCADTSRHI